MRHVTMLVTVDNMHNKSKEIKAASYKNCNINKLLPKPSVQQRRSPLRSLELKGYLTKIKR